MGAQAFDLADRLQTMVFVMLDLDIGMNEWLIEPFKPGTTPSVSTAAR
jgi:2-oxoglutarate ferredoxin oxidoreductase subunit alpha